MSDRVKKPKFNEQAPNAPVIDNKPQGKKGSDTKPFKNDVDVKQPRHAKKLKNKAKNHNVSKSHR